ncbi:restriction endonuclease [Herpetosiphon gulosus]|uniref:Type-2 restriction enzyme BanI n=1 Tax=Herpetosiphon gulosus TaxID=1973496 RepID=A0ABP9X069_9CHLR
MNYQRSFEDLESNAIKWWPQELSAIVAQTSIFPILIESQEKFIKILKLPIHYPEQIFEAITSENMPANLFLKHLVVLADYGGEMIQRLVKDFQEIFPQDISTSKYYMDYVYNSNKYRYIFKDLPTGGMGNKKLAIDGKSIILERSLSNIYYDMIMILLYGSTTEQFNLAGLEKCEIGMILGNNHLVDTYMNQKYINVSRITNGAKANSLGQIAQTYVCDILSKYLPNDYNITRNGRILLSDLSNPDSTKTPFDILVEFADKKVGIEVSFQVTTNSTIERKAGQARDRQNRMHAQNYWIAYVIDGAGNFDRPSAIRKICQYSDCTVAYSESEIAVLAAFIQEKFNA